MDGSKGRLVGVVGIASIVTKLKRTKRTSAYTSLRGCVPCMTARGNKHKTDFKGTSNYTSGCVRFSM